ncbi:AraC family transcriptional regulator [Marinobacter bohaiensis]|uniref:AraC family transcriptional regulator n=1 Tax=Marinobacter bohaiensis TaxID=2201898 RepID=UPI000DAEE538|nr:helix-turn-helix transcriptional regulator [Marinobacter bohaiensis]
MGIANTPQHEPQGKGFIEDPQRPVLCHAAAYHRDRTVRSHAHPRGQLAWAEQGVLRIITDGGAWVVPPTHAVWIAPWIRHQVTTQTRASIRYLYVDASACHDLPEQCQVMEMTGLLRALIGRVMALDPTHPPHGGDARLVQVVLDEIARLEPSPLYLPAARDRRLQAVMQQLSADPADRRHLAELARDCGASPRTVERLFKAETGMSFQQWRTRLRLLEAVNRLSQGERSATVAHTLGYRSSSAFVATFRRHFGKPPQSFIRELS